MNKNLNKFISLGIFLGLSLLSTNLFNNCSYANTGDIAKTPDSYQLEPINAMTKKEIAKELQTLAQYEIDSSFLFSNAIDRLENEGMREGLLQFKKECEKNIQKLSHLITQYGGEVPNHTRDFKGFFMTGYVGLRGITGDTGVMKALHTNQKRIVEAYENALRLRFPENIRTILQQLYDTVERHNQYIVSKSNK